jgi:hypothetical protein
MIRANSQPIIYYAGWHLLLIMIKNSQTGAAMRTRDGQKEGEEDGGAITWTSIAVPFVACYSLLAVMLYLVGGVPAAHPVLDTRFGFKAADVHGLVAAYSEHDIKMHVVAGWRPVSLSAVAQPSPAQTGRMCCQSLSLTSRAGRGPTTGRCVGGKHLARPRPRPPPLTPRRPAPQTCWTSCTWRCTPAGWSCWCSRRSSLSTP